MNRPDLQRPARCSLRNVFVIQARKSASSPVVQFELLYNLNFRYNGCSQGRTRYATGVHQRPNNTALHATSRRQSVPRMDFAKSGYLGADDISIENNSTPSKSKKAIGAYP